MKKIKQVFPSRNYITVDSYGDVEVIFNPVGDGFEGDDKLMFRKGRWAFRVNDFLSGKVMADGSKEGMGRKVYSLNLVYDDADGEPIVNTTYVDPTSVIPLDGSVVDVVGSEKLAQEKTLQSVVDVVGSEKLAQEKTLQSVVDVVGSEKLAQEKTLQTVAKEATLQTVAKEATLQDVQYDVNVLRNKIELCATSAKQDEIKTVLTSNILNKIEAVENSVDFVGSSVDDFFNLFSKRFVPSIVGQQSIDFSFNCRFFEGTVFCFGDTRFIALRSDCVSLAFGGEFLLLGDMSEYNNGVVKRLDGVKFAQSDVTKIWT